MAVTGLRSAKGPAARHQSGKELAGFLGGAFDTGAVLREFLDRRCWSRRRFLLALGSAALVTGKPRKEADELRAVLTYICSALANGNPSDAMSAFTKSFPDYDELARCFSTLTESYWVTSQVDVVDEQVAEPEAQMTVTWTLSLESRGTGEPQRRTQDLHLHLRQTKPPKWQIVKMQGVEFFRP